MHEWEDEWFKKHGNELYSAINEIEHFQRKHFIGVYGKEKWGCYRNDYLAFWNGGLYQLIFGYKLYIGPSGYYKSKFIRYIVTFIHNTIYWFDQCMIPYKRTKYGWLKVGLSDFNRWIGLVKLVHKRQFKMFNKSFQLACKKYPDIIDELICDIDGYELVKPCKWGNVDGVAIHNKYWKTL